MTTEQPVTDAIRDRIEKNPSAMPAELARELDVAEADIIRNLPGGMAVHVPAEDFEAVWEEMTGWEKVTFICISPGCVAEVCGPLPRGNKGHGMFNLRQPGNPLGGHLMIGDLGSIWLVSKPFFGRESHSVQFFNTSGQAMFSVYLGRDDKKQLIESCRQRFFALKDKYETKEG